MKKKDFHKENYGQQSIVDCNDFASQLNLEIIYEGRGEFCASSISVSRPGLQLAGYFEHFDNKRVQVIGNAEHEFLNCLPQKVKLNVLNELFKRELPCMIISRSLSVDDDLLDAAKHYDCPIFRSSAVTTVLVHDLINFLNDLLAPTTIMHGVLLDVYGVGVLITGNAGIGKSETALDLISRGHRLTADDTVLLKYTGERILGTCPKRIQYYMEVRGVGIINVKSMFGPGAIRPKKTVQLIIELVNWSESKEIDRLGDEKKTVNILGCDIQKLVIPVSPGRNIPIIIETAARKHILEQFGYSAINELMHGVFDNDEEEK